MRDGSLLQTRPAEFLSQIFTPLQLNPVEFTQLSRQEKNRVILSLIEFDWDVNWIREQFGEIPQGVDYSKHILEVLNDIQAENGVYFQSRQNINRDIRNKQAFISDIAKDIPSGYDYDRWNQYPIGDRYRELERLREKNSVIERAKAFRANFTSKLRGLEGSRDVEIGAIDRDIAAERAALTGSIERMKAELQATEEKLAQLSAAGRIEWILPPPILRQLRPSWKRTSAWLNSMLIRSCGHYCAGGRGYQCRGDAEASERVPAYGGHAGRGAGSDRPVC